MPLGEGSVKKLAQSHPTDSVIRDRYRGYDLAIKIDKKGHAIQLFMGKAAPDGSIESERYNRVLNDDNQGTLLKDYEEHKGKAT